MKIQDRGVVRTNLNAVAAKHTILARSQRKRSLENRTPRSPVISAVAVMLHTACVTDIIIRSELNYRAVGQEADHSAKGAEISAPGATFKNITHSNS